MNKGKRWVAAVFYLVLASVLVGIGVWQVGKGPERLSEERIAELREVYPIYPMRFPDAQLASYRIPSLDELIEDTDCFIYGEITGDANTYTNHRYTLRVICDTKGIYEPGEELTIPVDVRNRGYEPIFQVGMRIVYGTIASKKNPKDTGYITIGTYYVTDDGYVLSAFPEEPKTMKWHRPYTGVKVEYLLRKLRKPRWRG